MHIKKGLAIIACAAMVTGLLAGCSSGSTSSTKTSSSSSTESSSSETTIYGEISKIDGQSITLKLATVNTPSGSSGSSKSGTPPQQSSGSSGSSSSGSSSSGSSSSGSSSSGSSNSGSSSTGSSNSGNSSSSSQPSGNAPSGSSKGDIDWTKMITLTGKTKTITVDDSISLDDFSKGDVVTVVMDGDTVKSVTAGLGGNGQGPSGSSNSSGSNNSTSSSSTGSNGGDVSTSSSSVSLSGVYTVKGSTKTSTGKTYASTKSDQNSVLVTNGGTLTLTNATLKKSGDTSSDDNSNFYGLNAILAVADSSTATVSNTKLTSASKGSNAIFSTGNSKVTVKNVTINTTADSSRGLDATYGGTIIASNVKITTKGAHSAPLATDRGEGTVTVNGGTLSSAGDGSPCIYSTGNITVNNVTGVATGSQAAVVEGENSITIKNSKLTGAGLNGIMLYQSTSGDAGEGTAKFTAKNSTIKTTSSGPMFYITNTTAEATLQNTTLAFSSGTLVKAAGNSTNNWGTPGSNGGNFTLNAINEKLTGNIVCDKISTVTLKLTKKSTYKGTINGNNKASSITVSLDKTSKWTLTGNSYVTKLKDADTTLSNIKSNGHNIYYDASNSANSWLGGKTITLSGGGKLIPV